MSACHPIDQTANPATGNFMKKRMLVSLLTLLSLVSLFTLVALLAGCGSTTPNYDMRFGDAVRQARFDMTINPNAGQNPDPVLGMDGVSAKEAMTRYQGTFKAPPPVTNVINIGGAVGGK
jgi:hypothetical protein